MKNTQTWRKSKTFLESLGHAWNGILHAFKRNLNIQRQAVVAVIVISLSLLLKLPLLQLEIVLLVCTLVLGLEMINSALETLADVLHPAFHKAVGLAKDISSGAVLLASILAVIIGALLLLQPLLKLVGLL